MQLEQWFSQACRLGAATLLALLATAASAATPVACMVGCSGKQDCKVIGLGDVKGEAKNPEKSAAKTLSAGEFVKFEGCEQAKADGDNVVLRYRHERKWFQSPVAKDGEFAKVFNKFQPDQPCTIPSRPCLQARMGEKSNSRASHGIDSQLASPAGVNNPCLLGLPCGMVLPQNEATVFGLADSAFNGRLKVSIARGDPPAGVPVQFELPVAAGSVALAGARFTPGGVYRYTLVDASGRDVASGEFNVASLADVDRLKRLAARRVEREGMNEKSAWLDALIASEFEWDAEQIFQQR